MNKQLVALTEEAKKTTDQESCDKLKAQIDKSYKDIEKHTVDNAILEFTIGKNVKCTASGYTDK